MYFEIPSGKLYSELCPYLEENYSDIVEVSDVNEHYYTLNKQEVAIPNIESNKYEVLSVHTNSNYVRLMREEIYNTEQLLKLIEEYK